jgi:ketosteroid isomerase-like protein
MRYLIPIFLASTLSAQSPSNETAIRAARAKSNAAIAAHDVDATTAVMAPDYLGLSSGNTRTVSRDEARASYAQIFSTRPGVVFVRTPRTITVNTSWAQAGEDGTWTGKWSTAEGVVHVGGIYFAKWNKTNGAWLLLAETFVQTHCSGAKYCDAPPKPAK